MLKWKGHKSVHKCMMPHSSELPIKICTFIVIGILQTFWVYNLKKSNYHYESVVKTKKENSDGIF